MLEERQLLILGRLESEGISSSYTILDMLGIQFFY